jgi:aspartyl-tRNA synthetase
MQKIRTHHCAQLRAANIGQEVQLAGWVRDIRKVSNKFMFIALRDHYGISQIVFDAEANPTLFEKAATLKPESVVIISGKVISRGKDINKNMPTGEIEIAAETLQIDTLVKELPFSPEDSTLPSEDLRLKYRFIDLRREKLHNNILLRFRVMQALRNHLAERGFIEIQTPILTASSPEGARDFVVPSRLHPGKFYALPQAPQQYKQLLMCSGFDKYFQIAPCFRDENARADRSPGEFYQLDMEMAFVTQDELFQELELMYQVIVPAVTNKRIMQMPFPRIKYHDSMEWYGNDKPDIRFDMRMHNVSEFFKGSELAAYANAECVKAIVVPATADKSNKFFKDAEAFVRSHGAGGLGYINYKAEEIKGSITKFFSPEQLKNLAAQIGATLGDANIGDANHTGDSILLCAGSHADVTAALGKLRVQLAQELGMLDKDLLAFCWIVDFPMFEWNENDNKIDFCHNPFSMPQGGMEVLQNAKTDKEILDIVAFQYDIVCNGIEFSSGAIRNHRPDIMYKAFEMAGYTKEDVDAKFGHMISAFTYGAPPHGGIAPGLDRMVMVFADEPNIREIIAFPMNQKAQDPMMQSPTTITQKQLDELNIIIRQPEEKL